MFRAFALFSAVIGALAMGSRSLAQEPPKAAPAVMPLNSVSMEVSALQTLYELNFTKAQLEKLQQLTVGTAPKDEKRKAGKASKEYRAKMLLLRKALVEAKDNPQIAKLQVELEIMRDREKPFFDDGVNVTDTPASVPARHYGCSSQASWPSSSPRSLTTWATRRSKCLAHWKRSAP